MKSDLKQLRTIAKICRKEIIKMSARGGCFIGASLSCVDLIVYLYQEFLNVKEVGLNSKDRDYFLLSKGHDVPALYSVLAYFNLLDKQRLKNHCLSNDDIYWHPNTNISGVEFHSGSLGHCISIGMGISYFHKLNSMPNKTVVMLGDGELNEGSIWEAIQVASAKNLNNFILIIDRNKIQANLETEKLIPLEPLMDKFNSFGFESYRVNGHSFTDIGKAVSDLSLSKKPKLIIADTVRGKGLPSIENDPTRWFVEFTKSEVKDLLDELDGTKTAEIKSEKILVR